MVPIGLLIANFIPLYLGWLFSYAISAICFIVVAYEVKCRNTAFDTSGTSRVSGALKVIQTATLVTIIGFIYLAVSLLFMFIRVASYN